MGEEHQDIKDTVIHNQEVIDRLNSDLVRKNQEIRIIQEISAEINTSMDLDTILGNMLKSLDETFGFRHSMILLTDDSSEYLSVAASHGYEEDGIGAKVKVGQGIIGVVAKKKKLMRMGNIGMQMSYMNAVKSQMEDHSEAVKLPGLKNLQSQVAIPLLYKDDLIGVLAVDSDKTNVFDKKDELIIEILANQAASAIVKAKAHKDLKELNEQLEEKVKVRTAEVTKQKTELQLKNDEITDSIRYAKRIQDTLLTSEAYIAEHLPKSFVLYKPKDIVSGDFYWINHKEDSVLFTAVDCTGHGVPGAFVSIVAHGSLQRCLHVLNLREPKDILDEVNRSVTRNFQLNQLKDGMDMALCRLFPDTKILQYAGAQNPIYVVRKTGEKDLSVLSDSNPVISSITENGITLFEIKADKQPVGYYENSKAFTQHQLQLESGDMVYVFSDGYADQFGLSDEERKRASSILGNNKSNRKEIDAAKMLLENGKKLKYKPFKKLLIGLSQREPSEQKEQLDQEFEKWKGNLSQVDDVCVIGLRV